MTERNPSRTKSVWEFCWSLMPRAQIAGEFSLSDLQFMKGARKMPKMMAAHRSPWTKADLRELKAHSKARTPVSKVARAMKRTEGAVRQKAKMIGIGLGHRR
jgi:hypothetical protein